VDGGGCAIRATRRDGDTTSKDRAGTMAAAEIVEWDLGVEDPVEQR
jgi:hypothetical protein